jgi:hypothetical protein
MCRAKGFTLLKDKCGTLTELRTRFENSIKRLADLNAKGLIEQWTNVYTSYSGFISCEHDSLFPTPHPTDDKTECQTLCDKFQECTGYTVSKGDVNAYKCVFHSADPVDLVEHKEECKDASFPYTSSCNLYVRQAVVIEDKENPRFVHLEHFMQKFNAMNLKNKFRDDSIVITAFIVAFALLVLMALSVKKYHQNYRRVNLGADEELCLVDDDCIE